MVAVHSAIPPDGDVPLRLDEAGLRGLLEALMDDGFSLVGPKRVGQVIDYAPLDALKLAADDAFELRLRVVEDGVETALVPASGPAALKVMGARESASDWIV